MVSSGPMQSAPTCSVSAGFLAMPSVTAATIAPAAASTARPCGSRSRQGVAGRPVAGWKRALVITICLTQQPSKCKLTHPGSSPARPSRGATAATQLSASWLCGKRGAHMGPTCTPPRPWRGMAATQLSASCASIKASHPYGFPPTQAPHLHAAQALARGPVTGGARGVQLLGLHLPRFQNGKHSLCLAGSDDHLQSAEMQRQVGCRWDCTGGSWRSPGGDDEQPISSLRTAKILPRSELSTM